MISRLGRKRRDRRAQTQSGQPFVVESCEYLTDGAFALLRVSGHGSVAPVALITQGDGPESFDPLPQPDEGVHGGVWQIAFALPTDVIEPGERVWLHDGGLYLADVFIPMAAEPEAPAPAPAPEAPAPASEEDAREDERAKKLVEAWSEAARLREKLSDREEELAQALKDLLEARSALEVGEERSDSQELETLPAEEDSQPEEGSKKSRRATSRRTEDRVVRKQVAELEAQLGERDQRIEELQSEAQSIAALQDDARQRAATNDDLRALLDSEREIAAAARREVEELKRQLATVGAEYAAKVTASARPAAPLPAVKATTSPTGAQSPPWSALDDELLARIEKAKALTS